ncbi:hypothetical protein JL2886_01693 [Phaeobacter gallaeciensis]|uniref:Uncharacterized protein n=1 Tax=Phaeobacter gallaeciensis TaxID=60890 RepID=A0A1B0ZR49_9RHOB|nr:hypothetical protein JL2886_01693 [Phaeobacter gallaeciensis]
MYCRTGVVFPNWSNHMTASQARPQVMRKIHKIPITFLK